VATRTPHAPWRVVQQERIGIGAGPLARRAAQELECSLTPRAKRPLGYCGKSTTHLKLLALVGSPFAMSLGTSGNGQRGRWNWTPFAALLLT